MIYTKHIVGSYDEIEMTQRCLVCGELIVDYRGAMFENGAVSSKGWQEGELYISNSRNPQIFTINIDDRDTIINCQ